MKILLVADLHYALKQWDWLRAAADRFDLVVVAGDLLDISSIVPLEAQIVVVRKYFNRLTAKAPLLVSSGNHDILAPERGEERNAEWLQKDREERLRVDGDGFARSGYYFSILPWWDGPTTRSAVEEQLNRQAPEVAGRPWIWIYHPPPKGSPVAWNGSRDLGDTALTEWISRFDPLMVLGGHIHNAPFLEGGSWVDLMGRTWLFNSGRQPGDVPSFTIIDLEEMSAKWVSAAEAEEARLVKPLVRSPLQR